MLELKQSSPISGKFQAKIKLSKFAGEMLYGKALFPGTSTINQIERIMNVIPSPSKQDVESIRSNYAASVLDKMTSKPRQPLDKMIAQCPRDGLSMMQKLLVFNPDKRLTVEEALRHPYVSQFHNPNDEPSLNYDVTLPLKDDVQLSVADYRNRLYDMIVAKKTHIRRIQHEPIGRHPPHHQRRHHSNPPPNRANKATSTPQMDATPKAKQRYSDSPSPPRARDQR